MSKLLRRIQICGALLTIVVVGFGCTKQPSYGSQTSKGLFGYLTLTGEGGFVLNVPAKVIGVGDVSLSATYCDDRSSYFCIDSEVFHFAVPKEFPSKQKEWSSGGRTYQLESPLHTVMFFGRRIQVELISSVGLKSANGPAAITYYLYSPDAGLLAVDTHGSGNVVRDVLVSTGAHGFGAKSGN